eukprot:2370960-Rhodomonas_salina.2
MNTEIGVVEKGANKWGRGYGMVELNPRDDFVDRQGNVRVIAPNQSRMPRGRFAAQGAALCNVGRNVELFMYGEKQLVPPQVQKVRAVGVGAARVAVATAATYSTYKHLRNRRDGW